jgi:hypothetical protein
MAHEHSAESLPGACDAVPSAASFCIGLSVERVPMAA